MKKIISKIASFFDYLKNYKKINTFKKANVKLDAKLREREVDKIILKGTIIKMVRKYLRIDAKSKYIPRDNKNNTEIKERILAEFGTQMEKLNVRINDKLELI